MTPPAPPAAPRREAALALAAMSLALLAWLWPLGIGGRMPVGGDVTRFSIGLMAELGRAYRALRLPLWNDLWGYGFPGLAESQMGVYYPPHLVLYGLLPTEAAYTASLLLHTFWGACGAYWAARRFGAGAIGAALGGFAWAASGFFVIHLPHQWGYTVGSWMPWAWGLAWPIARGQANLRQPLLLAAVLALQILPGHFQLAFITEVGVLGLALWALVERPAGRLAALRSLGSITLALLAVAPLAAMQLWPTYELARLAESHRDLDYLSGFAAPPAHLVSYLAPGLFHLSPLWRPMAWDPFRSSPEEHLPYIGLAPLVLALGTAWRGWRTDPAVRALGGLALGATILSLGPYTPLFAELIRLPGFSYFRAPARWGLAAELALALLAAKGLTAILAGAWPRAGRVLAIGAMVSATVLALVALAAEAAFQSLDLPASSPLPQVLEGLMALRPWPAREDFRTALERTERPPDDPIIREGLLRRGEDPTTARLPTDRKAILGEELAPTAVLLVALVFLASLRNHRLAMGLIALTAFDLLAFGHLLRPIESGPIRPLIRQSTVLAEMARKGRGWRVVDRQGNLAMVAGAAPLPAYRTLDRPALTRFTEALIDPPWRRSLVVGSLSPTPTTHLAAAGVGLLVFEWSVLRPYLARGGLTPDGRIPLVSKSGPIDWLDSPPRIVTDRELARWTYGRKGLATLGPDAATFILWEPPIPLTRAWLVPTPTPDDRAASRAWMLNWFGDPDRKLVPLEVRAPVPEHIEIDLTADTPGVVMLSILDDPEWIGTWIGEEGERPAPLERLFGGQHAAGWIGAEVPGPGRWTLRLVYRGRAVYRGLAVSMVSWVAWATLAVSLVAKRRIPNEANHPSG